MVKKRLMAPEDECYSKMVMTIGNKVIVGAESECSCCCDNDNFY